MVLHASQRESMLAIVLAFIDAEKHCIRIRFRFGEVDCDAV
jgi:hypothetical protein